MNKTFFDFGSNLTSSDLNLVLASHRNVGVVTGFNRGVVTGNKLKIISDDYIQINQPGNSELDNEPIQRIYQACIARDGSTYLSTDQELHIAPIAGSKVKYEEVLLFAQHNPVFDPVVNPVNLVAYWNTSQSSFYSNIYEPYTKNLTEVDQVFDVSKEVLENLLKRLSFYNATNMVLLGIYGTYSNTVTHIEESFSLPILAGGFPSVLPKSDRVINLLRTLVIHKKEYEETVISLNKRVKQLEDVSETCVSQIQSLISRLGQLEAKTQST